MKNYQEFIKEAELSKTEGVPEDWIRKTDVKAQRELGVRKDEPTRQVPPGLRPPPGMPPLPPGTELPGPETMALVGKINRLVQNVMPIFRKYDKDEVYPKMTEIAIEAVKSEFPNVLDNVTLDVKMVDMFKVAEEMPDIKETPKKPKSEEEQKQKIEKEEGSENDEGSDNDSNETPIDDFLRSPELKKEIDKVKLMNAISQGEGLNTKMILHSDVVKDGLKEIFGDDWQIVFNTYDEMSKIHLQLNWSLSIDFTAKNMSDNPEGIAGTVQVGWDDDDEEDDEQTQSAEDILKSIEQGESLSDMSDEISDQLEGGRGKITVRAVDLAMLIHEIVKGIYQLVVVSGMQVMKDERTKMAAKMATDSFADEAEEFRYGPYIAAALRDVVNKCEGSDKYPNARLYVFGLMVQMDAQPFLNLMLEILKESDSATEMVQSLVDQVNEMFDEYQQKEVEYDLDSDGDDDQIIPSQPVKKEYKDMEQWELQELVDMYLDSGDFGEIEKIRPYLKESIDMRIYFERQVQKIKESKK